MIKSQKGPVTLPVAEGNVQSVGGTEVKENEAYDEVNAQSTKMVSTSSCDKCKILKKKEHKLQKSTWKLKHWLVSQNSKIQTLKTENRKLMMACTDYPSAYEHKYICILFQC